MSADAAGPDLHHILTDERLRNVQHKSLYQKLKTEHAKLQTDHAKLEENLKEQLRQSEKIQYQLKSVIDGLQSENKQLKAKCSALEDAHGPEFHEKVKKDVEEKVMKPLRERIIDLEKNNDTLRRENVTLQRDLMFLRTEHENTVSQHSRVLHELRLKYEAEVESVQRERLKLVQSQSELVPEKSYVNSVETENVSLNKRVHELQNQLQLLQRTNERLEGNEEQQRRRYDNDVHELKSLLQVVNSERESLKSQLESQMQDYAALNKQLQSTLEQRHKFEQEAIVLKNRVDDLEHRLVVDRQKVELEAANAKCELQKQLEVLEKRLKQRTDEYERATERCNTLKNRVEEQEVEITRKVQLAVDAEVRKYQVLHSEKLDLERQFRSGGGGAGADGGGSGAGSVAEKLRTAETERDRWQEKYAQVRADQAELEAQLKQRNYEVGELEKSLKTCQRSGNEARDNEKQMRQLNERFQQEIRTMSERLDKLNLERRESLDTINKKHNDRVAQLESERRDMEVKFARAETELNAARELAKRLQGELTATKKTHKINMNQLEKKLGKLKKKCRQLNNEVLSLRQRVPADQFNELAKRLKKLCDKHSEFGNLLSHGPPQPFNETQQTLFSHRSVHHSYDTDAEVH